MLLILDGGSGLPLSGPTTTTLDTRRHLPEAKLIPFSRVMSRSGSRGWQNRRFKSQSKGNGRYKTMITLTTNQHLKLAIFVHSFVHSAIHILVMSNTLCTVYIVTRTHHGYCTQPLSEIPGIEPQMSNYQPMPPLLFSFDVQGSSTILGIPD